MSFESACQAFEAEMWPDGPAHGRGSGIWAKHKPAIEAEARAQGDEYKEATDAAMNYGQGRADALREAADAVRALNPEPARGRVYRHAENHMKRRVLAILDPQP